MISQYFIEKPIFANVIAIVTIIIGLVCFKNLPVAQYPQIVPPTIQVSTRYPGASAEAVAEIIGKPIEQSVNGVEGAIYMSSTSSSDGSYNLTITFNVGTNLDTSLSLVQNLVNASLAQLPGGVTQQGVTVRKVSPNILMVVSLYSEDDRFEEIFLSNYALINLQNPLARLPGVGQVAVRGAGSYSMRIWLDPNRMQAFGITTNDVLNSIQSQNIQVVSGQLGSPPVPQNQKFQFTINSLGRLSRPDQFEEIIIKNPGSPPVAQIVRLKDIARVELSQQTFTNFSRFTGHKAALIPIFALPDANAISVADEVYKEMRVMSKDFPEGLKYAIRYDTTKFVRKAIESVYETLFIAGILVLIVILLFLQNFRAMLVPATTVPVTIIGAFIAIAALGFSINLMTLFALILAIGIVVDDAIIIVENSSYYIERGMTSKQAAVKAMDELTGPIMGITLALVCVFLPAAFFPGITGQIFRQFALVIASTSVISAINALTLKPVQCSLWLKQTKKNQNRFYLGFNRSFQAVTDRYMKIVGKMTSNLGFSLAAFLLIIILTFWGFIKRPTGFLPIEDQGYGILLTRLPQGASLSRTELVADKINSILAKTPGVEFWVVIGGLSILDNANLPNASTTFVVYKDWSQRGYSLRQDNIIAHLNRELSAIEEAQAFIIIPPPIRGLGQSGGFQMMIEDKSNKGMSGLQQAVNELIKAAGSEKNLQGVNTTFSATNPQLYLDIDRTKAESLEVQISDIFETLRAYLGSSFVNLFNKYNQVFQVYIQAEDKFRIKTQDIQNLYVRNLNGEMVPLGTLVQIKRSQGPDVITRYNLYPAASIYGQAASGFSSGQAIAKMEDLAKKILPEGIGYDWTSTSYQEKEVGSSAYLIYLLSLILVYMVLAALYESWTAPAAVILAVPIALVGVLLLLIIRGYPNDLYTQVGLVLMIALASKNAILIVEFARQLEKEGMSLIDAAMEANRRRFRPIVMTSFAFILGVSPLLFAFGAGSASQRALGTVVFGGMLSSTLLAIPFVPVLYIVFQKLGKRKIA